MTTTPSAEQGKPQTFTSKETMRLTHAHEQSVEHFRAGLMRLWQERGRTTPQEMASFTQVPESVFAIFLSDTAMTTMPSRREVEALLEGIGVPFDARDGWLERHARLEDERAELLRRRAAQNRAAEGLPPEPRSLDDLVGAGPVAVKGPLAVALKATTVVELQGALQDMRTKAGLSYARLAAATGRVPGDYRLSRSTVHRIEKDLRTPTSKQVVAFAKACGETSSTNLRLWARAAEQVQRAVEAGPTAAGAGDTEQLEVYRHPVRYPFGKPAAEEKVLSELRLRITPQRVGAAEAVLGAALWTAGFFMEGSTKVFIVEDQVTYSSSVRWIRWVRWLLMIIGLAGYVDALFRTPAPVSRTKEEKAERNAARLARMIVKAIPGRVWRSKTVARLLD